MSIKLIRTFVTDNGRTADHTIEIIEENKEFSNKRDMEDYRLQAKQQFNEKYKQDVSIYFDYKII